MRIVGIDPGISPAVACLDPLGLKFDGFRVDDLLEGGVDAAIPLVAILRRLDPDVVYLENVGPMPGQGLSSTSRFMLAYGIIRGVLATLRAPVVLVVPSVWKKGVLPDSAFEEKKDKALRKDLQKQAAVDFCRLHYPGIALMHGRCVRPDHNIAEAVCLAHFGLENYS